MESWKMKSREDYKRQADKFDDAVSKATGLFYGSDDGYHIYLDALDSMGIYRVSESHPGN
jgi:hypothetical protein